MALRVDLASFWSAGRGTCRVLSRAAAQNSQTPDAPPPSGAPQVGQWADEMALSVSVFAVGLRANTMRRWETEDCSWRWIFLWGSAVKRVPDQRISKRARSNKS